MLTNVAEIDQSEVHEILARTIKARGNTIILGHAGGGKTEMAAQVIEKSGYRYRYINLSVLEQPDFVGLPYFTDQVGKRRDKDGKLVEVVHKRMDYAAATWMPVADLEDENTPPVVMVFDEADKCKQELTAPLLEVLKDRTINGRPLNIVACFITGNLPDELAGSQQLSHAITNRGKVYKMNVKWDPFREWATRNSINPLILGYLDKHQENLIRSAPPEDPTAYANPSPRAWTNASRDLDANHDASPDMQELIVAGHVGHAVAVDFRVWLDHYRVLEPLIDSIVNTGKAPNKHPKHGGNLGIDELMVCCVSSVGRMAAKARLPRGKFDRGDFELSMNNVMGWLGSLTTDFQILAVKSSLDMDIIKEREMVKNENFMAVFRNVCSVLRGNATPA